MHPGVNHDTAVRSAGISRAAISTTECYTRPISTRPVPTEEPSASLTFTDRLLRLVYEPATSTFRTPAQPNLIPWPAMAAIRHLLLRNQPTAGDLLLLNLELKRPASQRSRETLADPLPGFPEKAFRNSCNYQDSTQRSPRNS